MGAGASTVNEYQGSSTENASKVVQEASNQVDNGIKAVGARDVDVNVQLDNVIAEVGTGAVGGRRLADGAQEGVQSILESVRGIITSVQLSRALEDFTAALPNLDGDAVFAGLAGSLQAAASMSVPVMEGVGAAILVLGEHLPYIAVAAGAIGAIIYTFKLSKDYDENVKNVTLWMSSVKDWLMLVAAKITSSGAASTRPLFEGLQTAMMAINAQMEAWKTRWRITKMLSSTIFERDFNRVKTCVLELKTALRDYLDEETQQRQEEKLEDIADVQVETNAKLNSIDEQLASIRAMLRTQEEERVRLAAEQRAREDKDAQTSVKEEVERIFQNIQRAAGVPSGAPVDFRSFVMVFETFFYGGGDMPSEQRRGLAIAVDRDQTKLVTKAAWIKFYHQWTKSEIEIEAYLVGIAEKHPTLLIATTKKAKALAGKGLGAANKLAQAGIESTDDAKRRITDTLNQIGGKFGLGRKPRQSGQRAGEQAAPLQ